jgi:hypothetical protein
VRSVLILLVVLAMGTIGSGVQAETPTPDVVRYEGGRLTVRVTDMPLDRLLAEIAAVTHATVRGTVEPRPVAIDFKDASLADGLTRIFGAESFMLTYASDGTIRTIEMLGKGVPAPPIPSAATTPSPRPPLADEEDQAEILQRTVTVGGALATALGPHPPIGRVLHALVQEHDAAVRAAAREVALETFGRDPAVEAAYLSTLTPVDDAVLAKILRGAGPEGAAAEWMAALAAGAPSEALRTKAAAVLGALQR